MAIALVQDPVISNTGGATASISFASTPTPGNLIIVAIGSGGASSPTTSVTDNQTGNTYTQVGTTVTTAGLQNVQIFYAKNVNATGTFTVTGHLSGATGAQDIGIFEYSGADKTAPFDNATQNTGSSTTPNAGSITPANNNSLFFCAMTDDNADNVTMTAGTNFTLERTQLINSTRNRIGTEDFVQGTAASHAGNFTIGTTNSWACVVAVFKPLSLSIPNKVIQLRQAVMRSNIY